MSHTENKVFPYIEALERSRNDGTPLAPSTTAQAESLIEEVMVGTLPPGRCCGSLKPTPMDSCRLKTPAPI